MGDKLLRSQICNRLRAKREALDLSQTSVANALNVEHSTYQRWESGESQISFEQLEKLSMVLRYPLKEWFDVDTNIPPSPVEIPSELMEKLTPATARDLRDILMMAGAAGENGNLDRLLAMLLVVTRQFNASFGRFAKK